ncbi:MAG: GTP 3',8-cyclase MoaA [Chloroflexota bacterium]
MKDSYGREVSSLRLSVTQRCQLACFYCHNEGQEKNDREMSPASIERVVRVARSIGIIRTKITGGEPLVRKDIVEIVARIAPHMEETSLVTNGILLERYAAGLKEAGLARVNVDLPSLRPAVYRRVTGREFMSQALSAIGAAVALGLAVKVNTVVLKGINDTEIEDLIDFVAGNNAVLQLIELEASREEMESGFFQEHHLDLGPLESRLEALAARVETRRLHHRRKYFLPRSGSEAAVEVVRPMHNTEFCANCSRIRLTADGKLKPCLLSNDGLIDTAGKSEKEIMEAFAVAIRNRRPYWQ